MKKKTFINRKYKKKTHLEWFYRAALFQLRINNRSVNTFLSFFKKFVYYNVSSSYRICVLIGVLPNLKFNTIKWYHLKKIYDITALKFYFDYSFVKKKKFDLLKTLITFKTIRHYFSLPLRGQRTRTHAKTRKKYSII